MFVSRSPKFNRSNNYRSDYFKHHRGYKKNGWDYHCAYCGRKMKRYQSQVDHIIPVHRARNRLGTRMFLRLSGIRNVNSPKNLTTACARCNAKKGSKGGIWILTGFLGRNIWFHRIVRTVIALTLLALLIYGIAYYLNVDLMELFKEIFDKLKIVWKEVRISLPRPDFPILPLER